MASQPVPHVLSMQSISAAYAEDDEDDDSLNKSMKKDSGGANNELNRDADMKEIKDDTDSPVERKPVEMNISGSEDESEEHEFKLKKQVQEIEDTEATYSPATKKLKIEKIATRLVSYGPDEMDDANDGEHLETSVTEIQSVEVQIVSLEPSVDVQPGSLAQALLNVAPNDVSLPPEPVGKCSQKLQEKIKQLYEKMQRHGTDMKDSIQRRKDFRNPSIYEKLIDYCGIDEKGTNYPPELFNTSIWGPESYYDELAKGQRTEADKKGKEKTKVEFVTVTKKQTTVSADTGASSAGGDKRKSKWDAQGAAPVHGSFSTSASSSSLSKVTVISSSGSIKKK